MPFFYNTGRCRAVTINTLLATIVFIDMFLSLNAKAYNPKTKELNRQLSNATTDSSRLRLLAAIIDNTDCVDSIEKKKSIDDYNNTAQNTGNKSHIISGKMMLGNYYRMCTSDYESAAAVFQECANYAANAHENVAAIRALVYMAMTKEDEGNNNIAIECYQKALLLKPDTDIYGSITGNLGRLYLATGEYTNALKAYELVYAQNNRRMNAVKTLDQNDTLEHLLLLTNIGIVHVALNDWDTALSVFHQVQSINKATKDKLIEMYCLIGFAKCMQAKKEISKSVDNYVAALPLTVSLKNLDQQALVLNNLGHVYLEQNKSQKAMEYALSALKLEEKNKGSTTSIDQTYLPDTYALLGAIATKKTDFANAERYLKKAIILYRGATRKDEESEAWRTLSDVYTAMHNTGAALQAYKRYIALRDSIFSQEKAKELTRIEMNGEFSRKQLGDSLVQAEKDMRASAALQKQKRDKVFFIIGAVLMMIIAAGAVYFLIYTRKAKGQIEMLMKEMHHRVKNNLQIISTLLNLQLADIVDENAKKTIEEGITRISSIALIHHHLYRVDDLASIEISSFIKELSAQVSAIYSHTGQQLNMNLQVPETRLDIDTAIPLGLILNELMTNSFKYAYTTTGTCNMDIIMTNDGSKYSIRYCDHGPGLSDSFNIDEAESLGMKIISNLSTQLGGDFHYRRSDNSFIVNFKDTSIRKATA